MEFNKTAYFTPNQTKNKTNTKTFNELNGDFSFYAEFQLKEFVDDESLIIGRVGYHMGIFIQKPNGIKFAWYTKDYQYNDIWISVEDIYKPMKVLVTVSETIKVYIDGELKGEKERGNMESYDDKNIFVGAINPYGEQYQCWFNGTITKVAVFDEVINEFDNTLPSLYLLYDFGENSKFKTFDNSGNGNHGIYFENPEYVAHSINEFNKIAPSAKIV